MQSELRRESTATSDPGLIGTARRLTRGSALRAVSFVVASIISILLMPYVVSVLGDRLYGLWIVIGTFAGYSGLLDLGLASAVTRYLAVAIGSRDEQQCRRIFNTALALYVAIFALVLVAGTAAAVLSPHWAASAEEARLLLPLVLTCTAGTALNFPLRVFVGALEARLRFDRTATLELLTTLVRTGLILSLLAAGYRVLGLAWATLLAVVFSLALHVAFTRRDLPFLTFDRSSRSAAIIRQLFSYSSYTFIGQLADLLRFQVAAVVVGAHMGLAAVTHYRVAGTMATYFICLISALLGLLVPVFSQQSGAKDIVAIRKTLFFATKISIAISSFVGFGLIAWGEPFIARWMGPDYLDAYPCLVLLAVAYLFALWQSPSVSLLYGLARHRALALFGWAEGVVNVALSVLLVDRYGLTGVGFAALLPMSVTKLLVQPVYVCRVTRIPWHDYGRRAGSAVLIVTASLILPALLATAATASYGRLLVVGVASALLYALPVWLFLFTPREKRLLLDLLRPAVKR
jgi:O-antigen/teichoic acid export membrane protein